MLSPQTTDFDCVCTCWCLQLQTLAAVLLTSRGDHTLCLCHPEFSFACFQRATQPLLVKPTTSTRTYPLPLFWTWFFPDPKHCWSPKSPLVVKLECKVSKTNQETHDTKHPVSVRNLVHRSGKKKREALPAACSSASAAFTAEEQAGTAPRTLLQAGCHPVTQAVLLPSPRPRCLVTAAAGPLGESAGKWFALEAREKPPTLENKEQGPVQNFCPRSFVTRWRHLPQLKPAG